MGACLKQEHFQFFAVVISDLFSFIDSVQFFESLFLELFLLHISWLKSETNSYDCLFAFLFVCFPGEARLFVSPTPY